MNKKIFMGLILVLGILGLLFVVEKEKDKTVQESNETKVVDQLDELKKNDFQSNDDYLKVKEIISKYEGTYVKDLKISTEKVHYQKGDSFHFEILGKPKEIVTLSFISPSGQKEVMDVQLDEKGQLNTNQGEGENEPTIAEYREKGVQLIIVMRSNKEYTYDYFFINEKSTKSES